MELKTAAFMYFEGYYDARRKQFTYGDGYLYQRMLEMCRMTLKEHTKLEVTIELLDRLHQQFDEFQREQRIHNYRPRSSAW